MAENKQFSKEEIQAALDLTHSEYMLQVIALLSHDPDHKELTYVKVPVVTPQGGTYLVSILHVDGPKVNLQELAKISEATENKNGQDTIPAVSQNSNKVVD